jgi:16S rRNA (cytosine1402-N4)-methyltransferase
MVRTATLPGAALEEGLKQPMDDVSFVHQPVLLKEAIDALAVRPGGRYVDCTVGGGGHAEAILQGCLPNGRLLGLDADPAALEFASSTLDRFHDAFTPVHGSYADLREILDRHEFAPVDGIIFDLGLSSLQLEDSGRGFSFRREEPLDMRFDTTSPTPTAAAIINGSSEQALVRLLRSYGEERRARAIARALVQNRPFRSAAHLAQAITRQVGPSRGGIHPATRTFQALRIAVNGELNNLRTGLHQAISALKPGGRLVVISYHSLEDRIVKETFRRESQDCVCPPEFVQCVCSHQARLRTIHRKTITPTVEEKVRNPRSRSARMRAAQYLKARSN